MGRRGPRLVSPPSAGLYFLSVPTDVSCRYLRQSSRAVPAALKDYRVQLQGAPPAR